MSNVQRPAAPWRYLPDRKYRTKEGNKAMLNDAAKKLVARAARVEIAGKRGQVRLGANPDRLAEESWKEAVVANPDFRGWSSAENYFMKVFMNEIGRE
jgi:hypothetical protein